MKYRKKPLVIDAVQYRPHENCGEVAAFLGMPHSTKACHDCGASLDWLIETSEGTMTASPGDYIIRGVKGELYPCKPDVFAATYSPLESVEMSEGPIDTRTVLEREPWQVPLWDAINRFREAGNIIQREHAVVEVNKIVRTLCERARAAEQSFREADIRATAVEEGSAEWEERAKDAERECARLAGALEVLVIDEVISAGRARELHGMSIDQQRLHYWRWYHGALVSRRSE